MQGATQYNKQLQRQTAIAKILAPCDEEIDLPNVRVKENEVFDAALRRFKRACEKAGILAEVRRREFYEKPTQVRKRQKAAAVKRQAKRTSREQNRRRRLY